MPIPIDAVFSNAVAGLTPSDPDTERAKKHRASIEQALRREFDLRAFFRTGSFGLGTSVRGYSDVDYFAAIEDFDADSTKVLLRLRRTLAARFPNSSVRIDAPAVIVPFAASSEKTEVVPAVAVYREGGNVYAIPNGEGGWMKSAPPNHQSFVREMDKRWDYRIRPLIRFLKWWSYRGSVRIRSFYIELFVASHFRGRTNRGDEEYPRLLRELFFALFTSRLAPVLDPLEISGPVGACATARQRALAMRRLRTALDRSLDACEAEALGRRGQAIALWRQLFPRILSP